ncbi:hypothetical protein CXB51_034449 [Gossypium anomalum]|uniref:Myb/SANT-like domain-containing protein n=1 Tax=Gossypium anomalum TaxID=47600 RepID=A0A8J6CHA1_9ROSI|nr:hypothetical protein CXB51_034449 [Gossypium anomalum]
MVKTRNFLEEDSTLATKTDNSSKLKRTGKCHCSFSSKNTKNYGKPQLKNKWDTLKKEWRLWRELLKESTGIGWCPSKKTIDATEEWWAEKIQENPDFKGFKKKGIEPQLYKLMWQIFGGIVTTGKNAWHLRLVFFQVGFLWEMIYLMRDLVIQMNIVMRMKVFLLMRYHQTLLMKLLIEERKHLGLYTIKEKKSSSSRKSSRNTLTTQIEKLCESMASPRKSVNEIIFPHSQYTISNAMDALRALGDEIPKKMNCTILPSKCSKNRFGDFNVSMLNKIQLHHFHHW